MKENPQRYVYAQCSLEIEMCGKMYLDGLTGVELVYGVHVICDITILPYGTRLVSKWLLS
jgi:hypothetical protein